MLDCLPLRMERQTLHTITFGLELGKHDVHSCWTLSFDAAGHARHSSANRLASAKKGFHVLSVTA